MYFSHGQINPGGIAKLPVPFQNISDPPQRYDVSRVKTGSLLVKSQSIIVFGQLQVCLPYTGIGYWIIGELGSGNLKLLNSLVPIAIPSILSTSTHRLFVTLTIPCHTLPP
jgi:hypothetical protein